MLIQDAIIKECYFKATRSSGSGGQHVNKVATKVELYFNVENSQILTNKQKEILFSRLKLTKDNILILSSQKSRSQYKNKLNVIKKLFVVLAGGLKTKTYRIPTKPLKIKRLRDKRNNSERKSNRKKPKLD